jgi:hypothetical protein
LLIAAAGVLLISTQHWLGNNTRSLPKMNPTDKAGTQLISPHGVPNVLATDNLIRIIA